MMPVINGLDFLIRLKKDEQRKSIPVILLSAKVDSEDVEAGLFLGADDFLKKPFKISELVDKINKILSIS
jgi:DNA-binding response OmpR family regulator